uniref:Uncharacterized protein n=1 Tax=Panagrolaimus sp. ES5 TaxID=591445 RepID=A0AC34FSQ7_9BILA
MKQKWKQHVEDAACQIHALFVNNSVDEISNCISDFYVKCPQESLRATAIELICKIHSLRRPKKNIDACIEQICLGFKAHMNGKDDKSVKDKRCITVALSQNPKICEFAFSVLLHLCEPSKALTPLIYSRIKELPQGIKEQWIQTFNLKCQMLLEDGDGKKRSFDAGCITNMYNKYQTDNLRYATMDVIVKTFKSASNINNILFVIQTILLQFQAFLKGKDDIFVKEACNRVVSGKLWGKCFQIIFDYNLTLCSTAIDLLFHIREPEAKKRNFLIYDNVQKLILNEDTLNKGFEWIQIFNLDLEKLKLKKAVITERPSVAVEDKKEAHDSLEPPYVNMAAPMNQDEQPRNIISKTEKENKADNNKKPNVADEVTKQPDDAVVEDECIEIVTCCLWEKPYKLITVMTPKACRIFVDEYLIKSKPRIVRIDFEHSEQKAVLLQLATRKWICLIDIKKLSPNQWKRIFTTLFAPNIILVGFAFRFDILVETFSFLLKLLHERQGKVLCLQKLSNQLIKDKRYDTVFLKNPTIGCGLGTLAKAVLDYEMAEQQSDSSELTQSQKTSAITEVAVIALIYKSVTKRLKKKIGNIATKELIKNAFISHHQEVKKK